MVELLPVDNPQRMDMCQSLQQVLHVQFQLDKVHGLDHVGELWGLDVGHGKDDVTEASVNEEKGKNVGFTSGKSETVHLHQDTFWK